MKISELKLENYKAFANEMAFLIKPITLFFGYNSAGKSAALRFLKLVADSTRGDSSSPINLRSDAVRGSDFRGLLSKHKSSPRMSFSLAFEDLSVEFTILDFPEKKTHVVQRLNMSFDGETKSYTFEWNPNELELDQAVSSYVLYDDRGRKTDHIIHFDGLVPTKYSSDIAVYLDPVAVRLKEYGKNFVDLSPDCIVPARFHTETTPVKKISSRGEGIISLLQAADDEVLFDISEWYKSATGYSFQRSEITIGDRSGHRFTLHPNADPNIDIDIIDTGEGMGQVLPVVSLLTLAQHNLLGDRPVISLEHPELHIHPDAHAHLADLFCQVITRNQSCSILVETHSENLLLGLQLAIVGGRIKPSDVAVHWVRGTENGAEVDLVEFDESARPSKNNWPVDVYRRNSKLARQLFEERKKLKN